MAEVTISLRRDPETGKQNIVIKMRSDEDALPHEHEQQHKAIVDKLLERGLVKEGELGKIIVEREEEKRRRSKEVKAAEARAKETQQAHERSKAEDQEARTAHETADRACQSAREEWLENSAALWAHDGQVRHLLFPDYERELLERQLSPALLEQAKRSAGRSPVCGQAAAGGRAR